MKTIAISEFKTHALKLIDEIAKSHEVVVITKRGKPLVQVVPHRQSDLKQVPGKLANTFVFEKDVITPLGEELWESCR